MSVEWQDELDAIAPISPYFVVRVQTPGSARPSAALVDHGDVVIGALRRRLGVEEDRVSASTWFFSYAARLWSIALATELRTGTSVALGPQQLWWVDDGAGIELFLPDPNDGGSATHEVVERQLVPLVEAWSGWIAPGALWGNATSALRGAARMLGPRAEPFRTQASAHPLLAERLHPDGRRRSCCLYYRIPGSSYCGDCCFSSRDRQGA